MNSYKRSYANVINMLVLTGVFLLYTFAFSSLTFATGYNSIPPATNPHGLYLNDGDNCKTCHAAHGAPSDSFRLLRDDSRDSECDYCHADGGVANKIIRKRNLLGKVAGAHGTHLISTTDEPTWRGPSIYCYTCHSTHPTAKAESPPNYPEFKDRLIFNTTNVCNTCHSQGQDYDGVDDPAIGAKDNWWADPAEGTSYPETSTIYEENGTLKAGKEKWCAGCHDKNPSVIQSISAPNVIGDEDAPYTYGTGWGFYKTGHGLAETETYPASGGVFKGAGKNCDDCHNPNTRHIDGLARTFDDGDNPNLDPSYYRLGYRLKQISGQEPMRIPWPSSVPNGTENYRLCTQAGCHNSGPFINSSDMNTNLITGGINRHEFHLNMVNLYYSADWNGAESSRITCVACHKVHGSTVLAMVRSGKLINREPGLRIWYNNPDVVSFNPSTPDTPTPDNITLASSTGTVWSPGSSSNLCTNCHPNNNITSENRPPWWDSPAPALSWTLEPNYVYDGVNPDVSIKPYPRDFTFRIDYTDKENDPPSSMQVWVDVNDDGSYAAGEKYDMDAVDPGDLDYSNGKLYVKAVTVSSAGDNIFNYKFVSSDGTNPAIGDPTLNHTFEIDTDGKRDVPADYPTIQAAIDVSEENDTVTVANGIYNENIDFKGKTIIVESVNGAAVTTIQGTGFNAPVVTFDESETATTVLDGFTINNQASAGNLSRGIYISNSTPTITNSIINGNDITTAFGAGIYVTGGGATLTGSTVSNNTSGQSAGGIYANDSTLSLTNTNVNNNSTGSIYSYDGGGIYLTGATSSLTISGGAINDNSGRYGAGVYINGSTAATPLSISNATISSNTGGNFGAGIYMNNLTNTSTISGTTISNNTTETGGGGIYNANSPLTITGSTISGNDSTGGGQRGGGLYLTGSLAATAISGSAVETNTSAGLGGAIYIGGDADLAISGGSINSNESTGSSGGGIAIDGAGSTLNISRAYIQGNRANQYGGGLYIAASAILTNVTISGNIANGQSYSDGGGIYNSGTLDIYSSTIPGNYAFRYGGGIRNIGTASAINSIFWGNGSGTSEPQISGTVTVTYSDIEGSYFGLGNIDSDPLFVNQRPYTEAPTTAGDYHIPYESPCVDSGSNVGAPAVDIDGDARPQLAGYDMGSDEYKIPPGSPLLDWTGEPNYVSDGVNPDSGNEGSNFEFRIKYTDPDNNPPSFIQVWVDENDNGSYEVSEKYTMNEVDPLDVNYIDGKLFALTRALFYAGDGGLNYKFASSDGIYPAVGEPVFNKTVTINSTGYRYVPSQYPTIQAAINASVDGDTVVVSDGTYNENIDFNTGTRAPGSSLTVRSVNGAATTTIQGTGSNNPVVKFDSGEGSNSILQGFTIDNQAGAGNATRGIYINNSSPTVRSSVIQGNTVMSTIDGGGIYITGGGSTIESSTIGSFGNANTGRYGSGIYATTSLGTISISNSSIDYNSGVQGSGIYLTGISSTTSIAGTSVSNNTSTQLSGGIYANNSPVSLTNSNVNNNATGSTASYDGGGVYMIGASSSLLVSGGTINGNSARYGGGVYLNGSASLTPLSIIGAAISTNNSGNFGAGVYLSGVVNPSTITSTTISLNTTSTSGGGIYSNNSPLTISDSFINSNAAGSGQRGGGIYLTGASATTNISNSTVDGNTTGGIGAGISVTGDADLTVSGGSTLNNNRTTGTSGGAIGVDGVGSTVDVSKSYIQGNRANQYGGGLYVAASATVTNSMITGNITDVFDGGGIYTTGTLNVMNSTIAGNYAFRYGGGLRHQSGTDNITNSIIWGNNAGTSGPQISGTPTAVTYSDIQGGFGGTGNINNDPLFVNLQQASSGNPTAAGDFHIQSGTQAIDNGTSAGAPVDDIDSNSRPYNFIYDMGADEYVP